MARIGKDTRDFGVVVSRNHALIMLISSEVQRLCYMSLYDGVPRGSSVLLTTSDQRNDERRIEPKLSACPNISLFLRVFVLRSF